MKNRFMNGFFFLNVKGKLGVLVECGRYLGIRIFFLFYVMREVMFFRLFSFMGFFRVKVKLIEMVLRR